ncbi:MAG: wax ester/triacylglycerol synthase family O-acyltransferase [Thermoleophilaceae bacterium]|nr:wax ester/triacylglycerol synthase family O-acyltransferase [Thermoleophilaceae bacterium]
MDQLHAIDSLFLDIENDEVQANIGGMSIFEGPAPSYSEMAQQIESALTHVPRYRQRLKFLPLRFGRPVWVDDEDFDITCHLIAEKSEVPVTRERVQALAAEAMAQHLDRSRPLWQIRVVDGLPRGEWALIWTVHHAMVDGIAATDMLALLLSCEREPTPCAGREWTPRSAPGTTVAMADALVAPRGPLKPLRDIARVVRKPHKATEFGRAAARAVIPVGRSLLSRNDSPLNGPIGPARRWATAELDLSSIKAVREARCGTVNDVVLAAVTEGLREFLLQRGDELDSCNTRTMVPVSVRTADHEGGWANHVSAVFVDLPVAIDDPQERLEDICRQMDHLKASNGAASAEAMLELADYVQPSLFALGERALMRVADTQRFVNTVTTNVPGPQAPLYCLGREMKSLHPFVMLLKDVRIATAIFSYNGGVYFGVTADHDSVPDVDVICRSIESSLESLSPRAEEPALALASA